MQARLLLRGEKVDSRGENGLNVSLVNFTTAEELTGGRIVSQDPAYDAPVVSEGTVRVVFDRGLPAVGRDSGMVLADAPLQKRPSKEDLAAGEEVGDFRILKEGLARARAELGQPAARGTRAPGDIPNWSARSYKRLLAP